MVLTAEPEIEPKVFQIAQITVEHYIIYIIQPKMHRLHHPFRADAVRTHRTRTCAGSIREVLRLKLKEDQSVSVLSPPLDFKYMKMLTVMKYKLDE